MVRRLMVQQLEVGKGSLQERRIPGMNQDRSQDRSLEPQKLEIRRET